MTANFDYPIKDRYNLEKTRSSFAHRYYFFFGQTVHAVTENFDHPKDRYNLEKKRSSFAQRYHFSLVKARKREKGVYLPTVKVSNGESFSPTDWLNGEKIFFTMQPILMILIWKFYYKE